MYTIYIVIFLFIIYSKFKIKKLLYILIPLIILSKSMSNKDYKNFKEENKQKINIKFLPKNGDDRFKKTTEIEFNTKKIKNIDYLIKKNHKYCANMRNTKSAMSSCIEVNDFQGKNPKIFIISTCTSRCFCKIINNGMFFYKKIKGIYYLNKRIDGQVFTVQILNQDFKSKSKCYSHLKNNSEIYQSAFSYKKIDEEICKK